MQASSRKESVSKVAESVQATVRNLSSRMLQGFGKPLLAAPSVPLPAAASSSARAADAAARVSKPGDGAPT
eukprot:scaffold474_cov365-Prasinococcus_capsulatus_cf.AAC.1